MNSNESLTLSSLLHLYIVLHTRLAVFEKRFRQRPFAGIENSLALLRQL